MATYRDYRTDEGKRRFMARVRIKGFKPTAQSFDSQRDAKEWAEKTERELRGLRDRGGARADVTTVTIAQLVAAYLADPKVRQLGTIEILEQKLDSWVSEYGSMRARQFGYLQISQFRDMCLTRGAPCVVNRKPLTPATANRYVSAMRACWNWGMPHYVQTPWPQKLMLDEPTSEALGERYGTADAGFDDVAAVIAATDAVNPDLGNLVRFLIATGARLSVALRVRWRDVNIEQGTAAIRAGKAERQQRVAMLAPGIEALARASKLKNIADERVFWQFADRQAMRWDWVKARKAFPPAMRRLRLHDCRHLCASFLATAGASAVELASQLGHSTLTMVKRYAHLAPGHRGAAHHKVDSAFNGGK